MPRRRGPKSGWSAVNKNLWGVSSSGHRKKQEIAQAPLSTPGGIRYLELSADDFYWWKTNIHNSKQLISSTFYCPFITQAEDSSALPIELNLHKLHL